VTVAQALEGQLHAHPGSCVMIVEDDASLRWMLSQALSKDGFEVLTAESGIEALRLYRENTDKVWLVVADIMMPEMDGLTAATEMRKIDDNVWFIFMSGYDAERIDRIGIKMEDIPRAEFFRKPFAFRDLTSRIKALDRSRQ
jgi:two-component system, cell cycle sensor histidine kinase and response regulator CckA